MVIDSRSVPEGAGDVPSTNKNVLYAEDDKLLSSLGAMVLTRAGYKVTLVDNGLQAWEALRSTRFDLLITDNDMPNLTGVELVAKARRTGFDLPIVLASGSADFFGSDDYKWLRFSATLQKPFSSSQLLGTVRQVLDVPAVL